MKITGQTAKQYLETVRKAQNPEEWVLVNGIRCSKKGKTIFIPSELYESLKPRLNEAKYNKTMLESGVQFTLKQKEPNNA